ncbi:hypothetical protein IE53DRAFT_7333 [Violaceomyces palustris]|uniref:Uncharacterized protein n=1 Tax=Violaceomyces palustris TaxID=1673888 RepID=A0ACD0P2T0_9BASI|nr:hypothetical protein IE53DRAFT_7333 [Violaceomyces palustris]
MRSPGSSAPAYLVHKSPSLRNLLFRSFQSLQSIRRRRRRRSALPRLFSLSFFFFFTFIPPSPAGILPSNLFFSLFPFKR